VSRADVELLRAAGVKPDPGGIVSFQRAVVRAAQAADHRDRQAASRAAGEALLRLAAAGAAADLRSVLSPDPVNSNVTWTVACYQIGDLTPSAVRDFADPVGAVTTLAVCDDPTHLAAELIASTSLGLRWVALLRTNGDLAFRIPDADTATDQSHAHATELADALRRWRSRISQWAEGVDHADVDTSGPELPAKVSPALSTAAPVSASSTSMAASTAGTAEIAELRTRLADAEQRIVASVDAHQATIDRAVSTGLGQMAVQLATIERRLAQALEALQSVSDRLDDLETADPFALEQLGP
jgi:hypothetical protein